MYAEVIQYDANGNEYSHSGYLNQSMNDIVPWGDADVGASQRYTNSGLQASVLGKAGDIYLRGGMQTLILVRAPHRGQVFQQGGGTASGGTKFGSLFSGMAVWLSK